MSLSVRLPFCVDQQCELHGRWLTLSGMQAEAWRPSGIITTTQLCAVEIQQACCGLRRALRLSGMQAERPSSSMASTYNNYHTPLTYSNVMIMIIDQSSCFGMQLAGKTDHGFIENAFKLLRDELGLKMFLTPVQFFGQVRNICVCRCSKCARCLAACTVLSVGAFLAAFAGVC